MKKKKSPYKILNIDPYLTPYESDIELRMKNYINFKNKLLGKAPKAPILVEGGAEGGGSPSSLSSSLSSFANGHLYFGFHKSTESAESTESADPNQNPNSNLNQNQNQNQNGWYYREWAPNADEISLIGDFNNWDRNSHKLKKTGDPGVWEIFVPGINSLPHGSKIKIQIKANNKTFDRIPAYCKRVVQNPETYEFYGQIWDCEYK